MVQAGFERWEAAGSAVVLSVPHAGRVYPDALRGALRGALADAGALEDRYVDAVARAARRDEVALVQQLARAWIDLNRGEDERDPRIDEGAPPLRAALQSAKVRGGLGLVPRRGGGGRDLWRRRLTDAEVRRRIEDHRAYHDAVAAALVAARARWGSAVLLDLHSMPPLGSGGAQIVIGDGFGRTAGSRFVARAEAIVRGAGLRCAINTPYAGGHVVTRHGRPAQGVHAIQLEIDRRLYLDVALDQPGAGLPAMATLVRAVLDALADEAAPAALEVAAE